MRTASLLEAQAAKSSGVSAAALAVSTPMTAFSPCSRRSSGNCTRLESSTGTLSSRAICPWKRAMKPQEPVTARTPSASSSRAACTKGSSSSGVGLNNRRGTSTPVMTRVTTGKPKVRGLRRCPLGLGKRESRQSTPTGVS